MKRSDLLAHLRKCDPRGPAREIQDLAVMNPQFAFAFRRAVEFVQDRKITPDEMIRRLEQEPVEDFPADHEPE